MTTIATLIGRLRQDLHDDDASRWPDARLQRHLERTIREFSLASPREQQTTIATTAGSRNLSIAGLTGLTRVVSVEWPVGQTPVARVPFTVWDITLTLLTDATPAGENAVVLWRSMHAIDASTLPVFAEEIVAAGAAGYAALEWANGAINRVNTTGERTADDYRLFAEAALAAYQDQLERLRRRLRQAVMAAR